MLLGSLAYQTVKNTIAIKSNKQIINLYHIGNKNPKKIPQEIQQIMEITKNSLKIKTIAITRIPIQKVIEVSKEVTARLENDNKEKK